MTGLLVLARSPSWVASLLGHKDSRVALLVGEFFLAGLTLLVGRVVLGLVLQDNVWTRAMERLGRWRGNVLAQGNLNITEVLNILTIANISDRVNIAFVWEMGLPCLRFTQR